MSAKGNNLDSVLPLLKVCAQRKDVLEGSKLHADIVKRGLLAKNIIVGNALINMYAKCGELGKAQELLDELSIRDVVSWTALIAGYSQHGHGEDALNYFEWMQQEGISPNAFTFACMLKACGAIGSAKKAERLHMRICREGWLKDSSVLGSALVDMYVKCGMLEKAQAAFDGLPVQNMVLWSALIEGYASHGHGETALLCYEQMGQSGLSPDAVTLLSILKACGSIGDAEKGKMIHMAIVRNGLLGKHTGIGNALVDMYAKCSAFKDAHKVLDELLVRDVVSWTAVITGYNQYGHGNEALSCFDAMQGEGISPNTVTYLCSLKACGSIGAVKKGQELHVEILRSGLLRKDCILGTALVDMYARCGALVMAKEVLDGLPAQNVANWTALIAGYAQHGHGMEALHCFESMKHKGFSPDALTFSCILGACSCSGLVYEGQKHFVSMSTSHGLSPAPEHYTCMVDLLARGGYFYEAMEIIKKMPSLGCSSVWLALLGACRRWGNVQLGKWAYECVGQSSCRSVVAHVYMRDIYEAAGMKEEADKIGTMSMMTELYIYENYDGS